MINIMLPTIFVCNTSLSLRTKFQIFQILPAWCCFVLFFCCYQSGTLYQSSNNYPDDDIVTQSSNFYFSFEGDSYRSRKLNLFVFISAREFWFPHFTFNLLKIFTKFWTFLDREEIFHTGKAKIFRFLIEKSPVFLRKCSVKPPPWHLISVFRG